MYNEVWPPSKETPEDKGYIYVFLCPSITFP